MTLNQDASYDQYIKGLMDISQAITSELYLEDILKLIVMVTARATGFAICSLSISSCLMPMTSSGLCIKDASGVIPSMWKSAVPP